MYAINTPTVNGNYQSPRNIRKKLIKHKWIRVIKKNIYISIAQCVMEFTDKTIAIFFFIPFRFFLPQRLLAHFFLDNLSIFFSVSYVQFFFLCSFYRHLIGSGDASSGLFVDIVMQSKQGSESIRFVTNIYNPMS